MTTQLGEEIRLYRKKNGYPLEDFAHKVGCSRSYMSMIERGEDPRGNIPSPNTEILKNLSKILDIPLDNIISMSETPYTNSLKQDDLKCELLSDGSYRLKARNGEIVQTGKAEEIFIASEKSKRQKELEALNAVINQLKAEEIRRLNQIAEILLQYSKSDSTAQSDSSDDYARKKRHFQEVFGSDQTVLSLVECLEESHQDEYKSILDSCEQIWQTGKDKSEAVKMYYDKMVQSMKDEIIRKVVAKLATKSASNCS